ncbi:MAG: hypothetical protein ACKVOB_07540 [Sphingomonas sp.]
MAERQTMKNIALVITVAATLAACGEKSASAPTGQVAATVAGQEITASEVRLEMGALATAPNAPEVQQAALQQIINRKLLAAEATKQGLAKTPIGAVVLNRARELALIELLQQKVQARVPPASADEAKAYVNDNPVAFAQRKLVALEQYNIPTIPQDVLKKMGPLERIDEILALLDANKIRYQKGNSVLDLMTIDPAAAKQIAAMKVDSVFVTPSGVSAQVSRIREFADQPVTGQSAFDAAKAIITQQRTLAQVRAEFETVAKAGSAQVKINPAFSKKGNTAKPAAPAAK